MKVEIDFHRVSDSKWTWGLTYTPLRESLYFRGARVLDLGCGWRFDPHYTREDPDTCIIGTDIDPMIYRQQLRLKVQSNAHDLPFADCSFDLISSVYVLEHVENPSRYFSEAARNLRRGGNLLLLTNSSYSPAIRVVKLLPQKWHLSIANALGQKRDSDNAPVFYRANTTRLLLQFCEKAGFGSCKIVHLSGMHEYFGNSAVRRAVFTVENLVTNNRVLAPLKMNMILIATK